MKKVLRYIIPVIGLASILLFGVSATAGISGASIMVKESFSEPLNLLLIGFGLIGFGTFIRKQSIR